MQVISISLCSLASITRIDAVELIVKKYLLLWWSFCVLEVTFYSLIYCNLKIKTSSNALTKPQDINDKNLNGSQQNLTEVTLVR